MIENPLRIPYNVEQTLRDAVHSHPPPMANFQSLHELGKISDETFNEQEAIRQHQESQYKQLAAHAEARQNELFEIIKRARQKIHELNQPSIQPALPLPILTSQITPQPPPPPPPPQPLQPQSILLPPATPNPNASLSGLVTPSAVITALGLNSVLHSSPLKRESTAMHDSEISDAKQPAIALSQTLPLSQQSSTSAAARVGGSGGSGTSQDALALIQPSGEFPLRSASMLYAAFSAPGLNAATPIISRSNSGVGGIGSGGAGTILSTSLPLVCITTTTSPLHTTSARMF